MKVPLPSSVYSRIALLGEISELEGEIFVTCLGILGGESGGISSPNSSEISTAPLGPFSTIKPLNIFSSFPFMVLLACGIQQ